MTSHNNDPFNLSRFIDAQARHYETAHAELQAGRKTSHWIWYVLPQFAVWAPVICPTSMESLP